MTRTSRICALLTFAVMAVPPCVRADQMDDDLAAAKALLVNGKSEEAATKLTDLQGRAQTAAEARATDHHALYILGVSSMLLGDDAMAGRALSRAVRQQPANLQYALAMAQFADMQDKPEEAAGHYKNALAIDPQSLEAWTQLGLAQRQLGRFVEAQGSFEKAAALAPKEAKYPGMIAQTLADQKKYDEAVAMYQKALGLDPKYAAAYSGIGEVNEAKRDADAALAAYSKAVELSPEDYRLIAKQVQLNETLGKTKERDAARERILALKKSGKINAPSFCRQIFASEKSTVMAFEYLDPQLGEVRYAFNVVAADGKSVEKRVALLPAFQLNPAGGMFDLDAYTATTKEHLFKFTSEPTYEQARDKVQQYLAGTLKPLSTEAIGGAK